MKKAGTLMSTGLFRIFSIYADVVLIITIIFIVNDVRLLSVLLLFLMSFVFLLLISHY